MTDPPEQTQPPVARDRESVATGTARPGGRTARTGAAVLAAALTELAGGGYDTLSLDSVAVRAGVHKTTVYRRWGTKEQLVADALRGIATSRIDVPDSGDVDEDLRLLARSVATTLSTAVGAGTIRAMVAGAARSPVVRAIATDFWSDRTIQAGVIVTRGLRRRQLPAGTDPRQVIRHLGAPLYHQLLVTLEPLTLDDADLAAAATATAAHAGVFIPISPTTGGPTAR